MKVAGAAVRAAADDRFSVVVGKVGLALYVFAAPIRAEFPL
mgnify:CR=1 FL=1